MKTLTIQKTVQLQPVRISVSAKVRYWEDATVNGVEDQGGNLIPLKEGVRWIPTIELETGRVIGWPKGTIADINYKVCDEGRYWLECADGTRLKWKGDYVPTDLLAVGGYGYGDYIILKISADGMIEGWEEPELNGDEWQLEN